MSGDSYKITDQHATYFVTCTVVNWVDLFTRLSYKETIVESLRYCINKKGLKLHAWVIMSNHIHFIARCDPPHTMSGFLRDYKKFTSKKFIQSIKLADESRRDWLLDKFAFEAKRTNRAEKYKVWKDSNHPVDLNLVDHHQKIDYIHNNPVTAGLVYNPEDYVFSSAADYAGRKGLLEVELLE
jgi:REP element-mobilizing transposase RayT